MPETRARPLSKEERAAVKDRARELKEQRPRPRREGPR